VAIVWAIRKLKPYLEGYHFKVVTDPMALKWLNSIESPSEGSPDEPWSCSSMASRWRTGKVSSTWWQMLCQGGHYQRRFEVSRRHRHQKLLRLAAGFRKCVKR